MIPSPRCLSAHMAASGPLATCDEGGLFVTGVYPEHSTKVFGECSAPKVATDNKWKRLQKASFPMGPEPALRPAECIRRLFDPPMGARGPGSYWST